MNTNKEKENKLARFYLIKPIKMVQFIITYNCFSERIVFFE